MIPDITLARSIMQTPILEIARRDPEWLKKVCWSKTRAAAETNENLRRARKILGPDAT